MNNENQHKRVEKIQGIAKIRKQDLLENYQKQKKKHDKSIEFGDCLEEEIDKLRDKNKKEKNNDYMKIYKVAVASKSRIQEKLTQDTQIQKVEDKEER